MSHEQGRTSSTDNVSTAWKKKDGGCKFGTKCKSLHHDPAVPAPKGKAKAKAKAAAPAITALISLGSNSESEAACNLQCKFTRKEEQDVSEREEHQEKETNLGED